MFLEKKHCCFNFKTGYAITKFLHYLKLIKHENLKYTTVHASFELPSNFKA